MPPRIEIIGDAEKAAPFILWAKHQWSLREGRWYRSTEDLTIIFFRSGDSGYIQFISATLEDFIIHPRSDSFPNGINTESAKPIDTPYPMFPLYDDDHGSMTISVTSVDTAPAVENYGVAYWISSTEQVLSWRCLPALVFGVPRTTHIEGVTLFDVEPNLGPRYYTPLANWFYAGGEKIGTPGKVRSVAYFGNTLICICTTNYVQYDYTTSSGFPLNPVGTSGGYFDELWALTNSEESLKEAINIATLPVAGWERLAYRTSPIDNIPIWFSADGSVAKDRRASWTLSAGQDGKIVGTVQDNIVEPKVFTLYTSPYWRQTTKGAVEYQDFFGATSSVKVSQKIEDSTIISTTYQEIIKEIPRMFQRRPDPTNYYIDITAFGGSLYRLTAVGFKGPGTWSTGSSEPSIIVDLSTICGVVTYEFVDVCGFAASVMLRGNHRFELAESYESPCWNSYYANGWWTYYNNPQYDSIGNLIQHETWAFSSQEDDSSICSDQTPPCDTGSYASGCNQACTPYYGKFYVGSGTKQCCHGTISCDSYNIIYVKYVYKAVC